MSRRARRSPRRRAARRAVRRVARAGPSDGDGPSPEPPHNRVALRDWGAP
jgi:hypothetical protein